LSDFAGRAESICESKLRTQKLKPGEVIGLRRPESLVSQNQTKS